jgi:hypothetical protein
MNHIATFENWEESEPLKKVNSKTGIFEDENLPPDYESISGRSELDRYFKSEYPDYEIKPVKGYDRDACEILTGLLVMKGDYTLNKALVYYCNANYTIPDEVSVKQYPC